ncbi:MAG: hypothetical protein O4965_16910 [Trichodesmium sp. St19_bin1]|nr:hypothetical protein [Trichodesmium sp. St7_bin2_1]MDE5121671.1 hypothetical protein [Trichodesmium sp. St19_bin1]
MSLEKDLFKAFTKPIKERDLLKTLKKSGKSAFRRTSSTIKQSEEFPSNKKARDELLKSNIKSSKWLRSLLIRK